MTRAPSAEAVAPASEDADLDKIVDEQGIDLPDGTDKLVPLAAVKPMVVAVMRAVPDARAVADVWEGTSGPNVN